MKYIFLLLPLLFTSCDSNDIKDNQYCYGFDERQCETDLFASSVPFNENKTEREANMLSWLKSQNVDITSVEFDPNFHEAVCEACHVCPLGGRFYITSSSQLDSSIALDLQFLHFEEENCE